MKRFPIYQEPMNATLFLHEIFESYIKMRLLWSECKMSSVDLSVWALGPQMETLIYKVVEPSKGRTLLKEVGHWGWGLRFCRPAPHPVCSLLSDSQPYVATCLVSLPPHLLCQGRQCVTNCMLRETLLHLGCFTLGFYTSGRPCQIRPVLV